MFCKHCHNPLPSEGFICPFCNTMMDEEQIKWQKENRNNNLKPTMVSEKYGGKQLLFQKRGEKENKLVGILTIFVVLFLIILLAVFVYFKK